MTIKGEILSIANQIANEGGTPSVAKVKARLSQPAPLPTIIQALKNWQHEPENIHTKMDITESEKPTKDQELERAIANAIAPLVKEIELLKQQVIALEKSIKINND
ncbi:hypothetical protein [Colwellia sp. MEBiC06753]